MSKVTQDSLEGRVPADRLTAAVGKLYYDQYNLLIWLTFTYYLYIFVRDVALPPPELQGVVLAIDVSLLVVLLVLYQLERIEIVTSANVYLTPIPVAVLMMANAYAHILISADPLLLVRGAMLIMAFGIVALLPWIFWVLVVPSTVLFIGATLYILGTDGSQLVALGIGAAMISYGGFAIRYNSIRQQVALTILNEERAEALEHLGQMKDRFTANMSHELRTPLTGLLGMVDLLDDTRLDAEQARRLKAACDSANTLRVVIDDILDLSKLGEHKLTLEPIAFDALEPGAEVASMMAGKARECRVELRTETPTESLPNVLGDKPRIRQILFNLVGNAIKFSEGGTVTLGLSVVEALDDRVTLCWQVVDTGVGIAEEDLERLFDRFEQVDSSSTRARAGAGLGLAISQELAELMESRIDVDSRVGEGSTFRFAVTFETVAAEATRDAVDHTAEPDPTDEILATPLDILVAEDNPVNTLLIKSLLAKGDWNVVFAENGQEAVEQATARRFDLILMDVQMPVMDGEEATRRIRSAADGRAAVPILALTANGSDDDVARYIGLGMNGYILKPIAVDGFYRAIARAVLPSLARNSDAVG